MAAGLIKIAEHGTKLLDQQDQMQRNGVAYVEVLKLQADYYAKIANAIPTSTGAEYLKTVNEMRSVTGKGPAGLAAAAELSKKSLMVDALLSNSSGKESHGEYYKLLRSAEMKGIATNLEKLNQFVDQAFSYITAFGGNKVTAQDYQTFARRGGAAFINADLSKAMGPLSVLMADLGGNSAGTAFMSLHQFRTGANTLSRQQFDILKKAHLLNSGGFTDMGGRINIKPGGMLGSEQYSGDEPGWIKNVLMPHLHAISGDNPVVLESLMSKLGRNRNVLKTVEMFGLPGFQDQTAKDMGLAGQVKSITQAYADYTTRNPAGVKLALGDQYESMMQAIGAPLMQAAIPVMLGVTSMFETIGNFANEHPDAIGYIGEGLAVFSVGLMALGSVAIIGVLLSLGGPAGLLAGLAFVIGTLAAFSFKPIMSGITIFVEFMNNIFNELGHVIKKTFSDLLDWFKSFVPAWMQHTGFEGNGFSGGSLLHNASFETPDDVESPGSGGAHRLLTRIMQHRLADVV
jgi:hypothetical protein